MVQLYFTQLLPYSAIALPKNGENPPQLGEIFPDPTADQPASPIWEAGFL